MEARKIEELAQALKQLLENEEFRNVALPKPNFWDIIHYGESSYENRYNRMFAWLLDPTANHGLGARVVNGLIDHLCAHSEFSGSKEPRHLGVKKVRTETETAVPTVLLSAGDSARKGRIDITVNDSINRVYLALECKMRSSQHSDQLGRYRSWVQKKYGDYDTRYFIFLTEEPELPKDHPQEHLPAEMWHNVTFEDLQPIIEAALNNADVSCPDSARFIIEQFLDDQQHRSAASIVDLVFELFEDSVLGGTIDGLLTAIQALEIEDSSVYTYARLKHVALADTLEESQLMHESLATAFEALGGTSTEMDRILATCWSHRPPMVDMSKDEETIRIIKELAEYIAGQPVEPGSETEVYGHPKFFKTVKISKGQQNVTLRLHDGFDIYLAGNNKNIVPAVLHHWGKDSAKQQPAKSRCFLRLPQVRGKLVKGHDGKGAKLAEDLVDYLTERQNSGDVQCGCGRHLTGLLES